MAGIVTSLKRLQRESTTRGDHNTLGDAIAEIESLTTQRDTLLSACRMASARFKNLGMDWLGSGEDPLEIAIALCPAPPAAETCEPGPESAE